MLAELKSLHTEIERQLTRLEALTATPEPPTIAELSNVRLALTKASRARFQLLGIAGYAAALRHATASERPSVERLRRDALVIVERSIAHIGCWTPIEVGKRWPAYCEAAAKMRAAMRERLAAERAVLLPLLRRAAPPPQRYSAASVFSR